MIWAWCTGVLLNVTVSVVVNVGMYRIAGRKYTGKSIQAVCVIPDEMLKSCCAKVERMSRRQGFNYTGGLLDSTVGTQDWHFEIC
jgi:hypothetical protein